MSNVDFSGKQFGKLHVIGRGDDYVSPSGVHLKRWACVCDCGKTINVTASQRSLFTLYPFPGCRVFSLLAQYSYYTL